MAEPLPATGDRGHGLVPAEPDAPHGLAESPVDVQAFIQREATRALIEHEADADRQAVLGRGWRDRPPTWIQSIDAVNPGDFEAQDDAVEKAERDLKTLEWVLEQQRREAQGRPPERDEQAAAAAAPPDDWLKRLLPRYWIATVKANREWVAAGGAALLALVWGMALFARRPSARPAAAPASSQRMDLTAPPPLPRRRRSHRHRRTAAG